MGDVHLLDLAPAVVQRPFPERFAIDPHATNHQQITNEEVVELERRSRHRFDHRNQLLETLALAHGSEAGASAALMQLLFAGHVRRFSWVNDGDDNEGESEDGDDESWVEEAES